MTRLPGVVKGIIQIIGEYWENAQAIPQAAKSSPCHRAHRIMSLRTNHSLFGVRMASLTPAELLDWLQRNQFLTPIQADQLRPLLSNMPDNMALAKELIRRDWLTPFQINQIMKGQQDELILGGYRLRERIGEGAMGAIFKAWNLRLGRVVAVKTLNKTMIDSPRALDRFRREVETAAQLNHPNIALVRDAEEIDGRPYLIMDYIEGMNLSQRVKKEGALPIGEAVEYARQAALGLQHAFERGIVHRDIKPANLIVTTAKNNGDSKPLVKILDFGLARYESEDRERLTQIGHMLGTVDFVAPEQAQDARNADIRADIYGLGCTLFYLLAGKAPFQGDSIVEKLGPRVTGEAPWVRTQRPDVPPALEEVLRKMMARKPEDRFQTPIEAAQALQPFAALESAPAVAIALPAAAGVVMATPVAVPSANVPMALPVPLANESGAQTAMMASPMPSVPPREAAFLGMSATGRDLPGASAPAPRRVARPAKPFPVKLVVLLAGGSFVSMLLCAGLLFLLFGGAPPKKNGTLKITKAKFSIPEGKKAIPGEPHFVLVWIERVDFNGPVTVSLQDLPKGVNSGPLVFPPNKDSDQIKFIVSIGTDPLVAPIRVVAECEAAGAKDEWPLTLEVGVEPWKLKKK
jgi:tRNA A-37 threonylcarbamoyl transferase component Bud32